MRSGPTARFQEPGGQARAEGFSMFFQAGPFLFGTPEEYARGKAMQFPDEGGPVILVIDVSEDIIMRASDDWFPLSQGLVQFDSGTGLEELAAAWATLVKRIQDV